MYDIYVYIYCQKRQAVCPLGYNQSADGPNVTYAPMYLVTNVRLHITGTNEPKSAQ